MCASAESLMQWLREAFPKPHVHLTANVRRPSECKRVIIFARLPSPTYDYYLAARLDAPGMPESVVCNLGILPESFPDADGTFVIICRYASLKAVRWIKKNSDKLSGVALIIDDDLAAVILGREASLRYRWKLLWSSVLPAVLLRRHLSVVLASTPYLAQILGGGLRGVRVLPPAPLAAMWKRDTPISVESSEDHRVQIVVAYHATSIHVSEHAFLLPILREVLSARPNVTFEVFGGKKVEKLWRNVERVKFRRPISWNDYLREGKSKKIDIMLVPLAPLPINESRSDTKRIDIARYGAAAILSASTAYGYEDGSGEILLPFEANRWKESLLRLIDDEQLRTKTAAATASKVATMTKRAAAGLEIVLPVANKRNA